MALTHSPRIVTDGLVLCLDAANTKSYPGSGTTWTDLSGNGNNGTLTNGPTFSSANGGSIVFDGVNDYVTIADNSTLNFGTGNFTVLVWVGGISTYPGGAKTIIRKGSRFGGNIAGWGIVWASNPQDLYFIVGSSSARLEGRCFPNGSLNGWSGYKMLGMQRSGTSWRQIADTSITNLGSFSGDVSGNSSVDVGYNSVYNSYLSNNISHIQIYNRALTAQEIQQNYNATKGRFGL